MLKTIKKTVASLALGAAAILGLDIGSNVTFAQTSQFAQSSFLTSNLTSGVLATTPFTAQLPPISLAIQATNPFTIVTNQFSQVATVTNTFVFIYNAQTMGTNFSTNFNNGNGLTLQGTVTTYGVAILQSGGSNNCQIK